MENSPKLTVPEVPVTPWVWPLDLEIYDRSPVLSSEEQEALAAFLLPRRNLAQMVNTVSQQGKLTRLMQPLANVFALIEGADQAKTESIHLLLRMCAREGQSFWAWAHSTWLCVLGTSLEDFFVTHKPGNQTGIRQYVIAAAYLLGCFRDLPALGGIEMVKLAYKVFGRERLEANLAPVVKVNEQWGYSQGGRVAALRSLVAEVLLLNGNPNIREITLPFLQHLYEAMEAVLRGVLGRTYPEEVLSRVLYATQFTRHLDQHGYVRFKKWRFFGEDGLAGEEVSVWMYEGTLKIEYQATALSEYALRLSPDHQRIEAVKNPRRIETHFRSPQLHLWQTSETEWLLALRRPEPAPRKNRGEVVALARQLPLPEVGATG